MEKTRLLSRNLRWNLENGPFDDVERFYATAARLAEEAVAGIEPQQWLGSKALQTMAGWTRRHEEQECIVVLSP